MAITFQTLCLRASGSRMDLTMTRFRSSISCCCACCSCIFWRSFSSDKKSPKLGTETWRIWIPFWRKLRKKTTSHSQKSWNLGLKDVWENLRINSLLVAYSAANRLSLAFESPKCGHHQNPRCHHPHPHSPSSLSSSSFIIYHCHPSLFHSPYPSAWHQTAAPRRLLLHLHACSHFGAGFLISLKPWSLKQHKCHTCISNGI